MTSTVDGGPVRARAGWAWPAVAGLLLLATLAPEPAEAQTGICERTQQVQDGILDLRPWIFGVTDCANVTDAHLAAITGTLDLSNRGITALAAGDLDGLTALTLLTLDNNSLTRIPNGVFDDLTALTWLRLDNNSLTRIPNGVFDGLTALTELFLYNNSLTRLPVGVFDALTSLTQLHLHSNSLATLPDDVFEELTALTALVLAGNPGALFSPTADALPDDGEVLPAGGTVTLDGSGSGGAWGTNVTYSWALTSPASGVTVTFDDATSVTPVATIPALAEGAELTFTLTVTGRGGTSGIAPDTDTATVTVTATAGICGRTQQVRSAILDRIPGVSDCANVTDAHLAAITGTLDLSKRGITALAAGDFEELTALTTLRLDLNSLTRIPNGVFDELTSLATLWLEVNSLTRLPVGVFDELTALTQLSLYDNSLATLPDDVFEELTALTNLRLAINPGAPFAPTADALPDDGTVLPAGGTVTLDGSGSGGAWGTNVTYGWALTDPASGVTVTFDDATSVTPVATIPALAEGTELTFTLTVTGRATDTSRGSAPDTDTATVTVTASTDATLSDLEMEDGDGNTVSLTPSFASTTASYTASVANSVDEVTVTATENHASATVKYYDAIDAEIADADTNAAGHQVALAVGANTIVVAVTAEDGSTSQDYTVTVTRAAADTPPTDPVWSATMTAGDTRVGHGYDATDTPDTPAIGALDDDDFNYGSLPYRVLAIDVATNVVRFAVEPGGQLADETLTLEFGGHALAFSDRLSAISIGQNIYWNVPAALDDLETEFPVGSTATVCLRTATQVCPTGSIVTPPTLPTLSIADAEATEGGKVEFTVTLSALSGLDVEVDYATTETDPQSAVSGTDFTAASGTLEIEAGNRTGTIEVQTTEDDASESAETFTLTISNPDNATLGAKVAATGTINDDDAAGVTVSATALTVTEQDTAGDSYTVVLDTEPTHAVTVTVGGHSGTDVSLSASTLTFTPSNWDRAQTVTVTALNDDDTANDAVTLTHAATSTDGNYSGITIAGVAVTVTDNDTTAPAVTLVLSDDSIGEDGGVSTVTATVSPASAAAFTVTVAAAAVSPAVAADFRLSANRVLSFAENATTSTGTVTITGVDDDVDAADKTVTVSGAVSAAGVTAPANRTLTLNDDDLPVVTIARDKNVVNEDDGDAGFTLTRVGLTAGTLAVTVEVTQQADRDLLPDGAEAMRTVTFAAGSATAALAVALENDNLKEVLGGVTVEVQPGTAYTVGDPASATVTVVDTDKTTATPANLVASPGAGVGEVTLAWDTHALHLQFVRHQYRYKTDGAYGDWTDIPNSGQHSIGEGDGSNLTGYTVTGLVGGQAHTFEVRTAIPPAGGNSGIFSDSSNEYSATPRSAAVSFEAATYSVDEGATVEVTVSLSGAPGREVTVPVTATAAGGATAQGETGADWSGVPENVTFGATDTEQSFTLAATQDMVDDDSEGVVLSFGTLPDGVTAGTLSGATVTINDDDAAGVTVSATALTVTEQDTAGDSYTVVLDTEPTHDVTVTVGGHSGTDVSLSSSTLTFTPSNWDGAQTVTVTALNDDDTANDAVTLTHTATSTDANYSGIAIAAVSVTVTDNDTTAPAVTLVLSAGSIGEDGGVSTVTATVTPASAAAFTVTVAAAAVSPAVAADFRLSANPVLSFAENATASTGSVTITGVDDDVDAADKTVTVSGTVSAAGVTAPANRTLTLNDDDLPVVTIASDKNVVNEDDGDAGFTLTRVGLTAATLAVTVEVTQQADRDLLPDGAEAMRTVTFAAGSATAALAVALENDNLQEVLGGVTVEVQPGTAYTVGAPASATVTVVDTDNTTATPANLVASPGAGVGEVTLAWDTHALHLQFVRHQYRYKTDGAYGDWTDIPNSGQHNIGEGDGSNLTGYTVTGLVGGQAHTFEVRTAIPPAGGNPGIFSDSSNEYSATPRSAAVSFEAATYSVDEGATVEVTVSLSGAPGREVTVAVTATAAGGATAQGETGADWSGVPENVTFGATDTEQSFTLAATQDMVDDDSEGVVLSFGTLPDGVTAGTLSGATVTLEDDDAAGVTVSATALTVTEQDTTGDSYTVVLDTEPTHEVTVTVGGHSGTDVSLSASALTFTPSNWDRAQTVTVTARNDDDTADDAVALTHTATSTDGNYSGITIAGVAVTVTDNDTTTPAVTLVLSAASVGENGGVSTVTATVAPASAAAFTVTVAAAAVAPAVAADFRLSANTVLRFAENATTSTGTVTITGVDDDVDAADKTVTVSGTVSATSVTAPANRTLTLEDDDAAGVRVSATALTVTEQDATGDSYTVVLDTEPTHDVTVTVGGHAGTDVSLSASALTFTTSNWDRAQTVTVTARNDDDTADDAVALTHAATSTDGNYSGIAIAAVSVTVTDNDTTTPAVTLVLSDGSIGENGGVSTVTATVSPASAAAFTVTISAAAVSPAVAADFRLSANRVLSFAENATTSAGTVTITGVDNDVDAADKTVTVSGTVSAAGVTAPANRTLTLEDDDAAGVTVSVAALTVTEQDTAGDSYTVVLDTEPTHDVTVTVGGHAGTDVSLSASVLTFTTSNWDRAQTVTVTALNDDDTANDAVTLTHTATSTDGNYSGITIAGVAVTVTDNDTTTPAVTLVLSDGSIGENGGVSTVTATVSPASATAFTVTISAAAVSPAVAADFRLSANRVLSFAENATTSAGTVTITGVDNDVDAADKTVTVSGTVSAAGVTAPANRTLTLEDDDAAGVTVSATALTVTEQDTAGDSYTVVLDTEPTHEVTVTVGGHSGTDVSLSSSTLIFTTSNWDQAQTVTVTARNDDDTADDAVTLTHTAASTDSNYSGITIAGVAVTVTDNDTTTPAVTLVLSDGSIGENGGVSTVTATVSPASAAAFTVTVAAAAVSPATADDFELSTNRVLSFAENATTSAGTVTITGVDNDVDAADKTVTVSGTVSAAGVTAPANRTLTLEDDDAAGVTVSATALTVTEQDTAGDSYTVVLDTEPTHEVTVTVGGHSGTDVSLSSSTLIFTTSNWDQAQTVTVTARNDDDTADDAVTLTHTAASTDSNYSGITIAGVAVTVTDNDTTTPAVTLVLSDGSIGEDGGVSTVTATVSPASAAAFTVTVAAAAVSPAVAADFRLSANPVLSFAENATASTGTVTITGVDDDVDAADKTVTVSGTVTATGVTAPANRTLTLEDDDAAGVTVSVAALTVTEQDTAGDSYTVVLGTEPTHEVTVTVGGHSGTDVSLSASTLTFTTSNWDRAQTVTVTALNDDDTANDAVTLTHTATSTDANYSGIAIAAVSVTVTDNDTTTPAVTLVLSDGSIGENGGVSTVTATVSPASAAAFTVTISAAAVSPAVAADFRLSANTVLSFAENATTSTGSVTITGVDDDVDAADKTVTVSGTVSATSVTAPATRTLTLEDDDAAGVRVSATALTVTEQDATGDSYTVVLDTEPTHDVTVTVGGHAGTDVSLSASALTFTTSNWDRAQTVTVTARNDDDTADDAVTLTHTATSTDANYSGIAIADVSVTVTDNDTTTPAVTLVLSGDSIGEDGGISTVTATVSPASAAAFTVTISAAAVAPAVAADFRLSANTVLSFAENATTSTGSVTITGVDDDVDAADKTVTVSGTVSATGVTAPPNRTLTLEDDDAAGVRVSATALTVTEQDATGDSYTVVLDTEPTHEVTVTVGGHAGTDVSLSASALTFTTSNWDRAQTVTVTALNDDDTANDAVTLTHTATSTDANYSGIAIADVSVTVTDNDTTTPAVTLVLSGDSIGEDGGISTVTATVSPASAAAFTVTISAAAVAPAVAADFRLSANTVLSFAENATTSTGSVTITGVDDDVDAADKTVTVSGTVSATGVTAPPNRTLTLEDDDAAGVRVSATALTVTEQDATGDSYTLVLDTEPTHEVTVTVGGHAGTDVSLSASALTFTTSNWDRAQTVTVTALNDDDTANDAVTLTHTATSTDGNYSGIAIADVSVTVTDNDTTTPAVTLVLSAGSIGEDGGVSTVTATVSPASAAAFTVTISAAAVAPAVAADFRLSANTVLSFAENATTSTGSVTITGVDDDVDAADKTVTVSGTVSATGVTAPPNRTLTLEDDDAAGVRVSATALTVTEQDATGDSYTVVLDTEPTHEVTVTVGGHAGTDVSLSASALTFTTSNWDQAQTVTVTARNDDDTADDAVALTHAATSTDANYSGIAIADVSVTVTDNDTTTPAVTLVLSGDSIGEDGGISTVTATVSPASAAAFTVTISAAAVAPAVAADFRLSANTVLSFAENATTSTGSVTITGVDDDVDAADKTVTVSGTVSATSVTAPATRTLTLEDDDAAGVRVSATALTVTEQDATGDSYTVVLDTEPTHDVTVTVGGHAGTDVSLSASALTFTTSNWDRAQTVTVTARNDDDTADDAVTLTHAATSTDANYSGIAIADVSVTVTDNDTTTPAVTLVLSAGSIGEDGGVSTVTATVAPASAAAFTVTISAAAVAPAVAADFRLSANTVLSFAENATTSTGSVTITGVDDDVDAADKTVTVSGTVSATSVTAPATRTLTLEDDDAAGVRVSATALTVTEQDATGDSYTVVLDTEPTHDVTVTVGGHAGTDVSLSASALTFTTSNWDRAQTVTVTARNDDDTADDAVTLTHTATSTDANYSGIAIADVSVTVTDNDTTTPAVTLVLSGDSIGEDGGVSTVTATVAPASAAAFTVTISAAAVAPAVAADFRLSANTVLSFAENATTSTGSVTITGVDDDVDAADKTVTVSGTVSATGVTAPPNRTLTLEDDDAAGVRVSATALTVTEQDATGDSYTLVLDTEPTHEVTVTVGGHAGTDVSLSSSTLTFTTSNWDRAQTVTVTALNDDDTANDAVTLTHTATSTDGNYSGIAIADVSVTVTDNDTTTPAVTLVLSAGSIGEDGGVSTVTATVSPASAAAFTVTISAAAVAPAVAADFRLSANTVLSFAENATTSTGSVTITGVDDDVDAADKTVTVSGTVSNAAIPNPADVTLTIFNEDADTPPPAPTVESFEVTSWPQRGGDVYGWGDPIVFTLTFGEKVRVKGQPQPTLAFDLGGSEREARYHGLSDTDYVHGGPQPRPRPQAVKLHFAYTVKPGDRDDDGVEVGELSSAIRLGGAQIRSAATGVDANLSHAAVGPLSGHKVDGGTAEGPVGAGVTIIDTEGNPLELQANGKHRLVIRESTRGRYGLKLNTRPTHTVHLRGIQSDGDEDLHVLPNHTVLPIAPDEWETPIWMVIRAAPDDDAVNGERVFLNRVHSKDPAYNDLILPDVLVVEADDDVPVSLSVADAEATEGEDATLDFLVRLDGNPGSDVTVDYRTQDDTAEAGSDYTETSGTLTFAPGEHEKTVSVPIEDDDVEDDGETFTLVLSNALGAGLADNEAVGTIRNSEGTARPELTAEFRDMPETHDGESAFTFRVAFSEDIGISFRSLREDAFTVTGGRVTGGRRVDDRRDLFEITVEPDSDGEVTIALPAGRDCGRSGAICTKGDNRRPLTNSPSATVAGPLGIAVADARVEEGDGVVLAFAVTLSRAASERLTVDYATEDGSAHAGDDYTAASGTLTFQAGESSQTIEVTVLDDAHDEGKETLTLTLSNPSSGRVTDGEATGTIKNHDPMPRALLARFGRTAALHVVEHVEERLEAPREPGFRGRFAGRELRRGMERDIALNFLRQLGGAAGAGPPGMGAGPPGMGAGPLGMGAGPLGGGSGPAGGFNGGGLLRMGLGGGDVLTGSAFALGRQTRHGGILSLWSRGAQSRFSSREGALSLGGDVRTTMVGADYAKGPLVTGLSLSHSRGLGEYVGVAGGQVDSVVTGLYPWLGFKATDRVTVWGVAGYGRGGLLLTPKGGPALRSGLSMVMAAAGTRGELVGAAGGNGFGLAFKADALWVGTSIDGVDGPAGRLKASAAAVTRFRTGLEGSRAYTLGGRLSLTPSVEVGLRHDGGDAETGAGMDVGGGLMVSDRATGLAVDVRVRTLLVHQAVGFRERGVSVSLSYNPTPSSPLGFTARVAPSWGGQATSGAEALWGRETMAGMAHGGVAQGNSLDAEVGYGLPVGSRLVGTPRLGLRTSEQGRDYRLGYSLGVLSRGSVAFELGVEAQRRENPMRESAENGVLGRASLDW